MTECPLAFVPHSQYSVMCNGFLLQYPDDDLRGSYSSHPHLHQSSVEHRLGLVSPSTRSSVRPPYIHLCHLAHQGSHQRCSLETIPRTFSWMPALFREREPPLALGLCWCTDPNSQQRIVRRAASFPRHIVSRLADHPLKGQDLQTQSPHSA